MVRDIVIILAVIAGILFAALIEVPIIHKIIGKYRELTVKKAAKSQYYKDKIQRNVDRAFMDAYYQEADKDRMREQTRMGGGYENG